jgi:hypothetical protein
VVSRASKNIALRADVRVFADDDEIRIDVGRAFDVAVQDPATDTDTNEWTQFPFRSEIPEQVEATRTRVEITLGGQCAIQSGNLGPSVPILGFNAPYVQEAVTHRAAELAAGRKTNIVLIVDRTITPKGNLAHLPPGPAPGLLRQIIKQPKRRGQLSSSGSASKGANSALSGSQTRVEITDLFL